MNELLEKIIRDAINRGRYARRGQASMVAGFALAGALNHEGNGTKMVTLCNAVYNLPSNDYTRDACIALSSFLRDYEGTKVSRGVLSHMADNLTERASNC